MIFFKSKTDPGLEFGGQSKTSM